MINELKTSLQGEVLDDAYSLGMYATDASIYQIRPIAVVLPNDEADVKRAIQIARSHQANLLPRGAGTSLAGQTVGNALVLDFSKHMNNMLEINTEERWARVQPGLARDDLNDVLAPHGLHFAPDPATSSRANVGGMVGNNSSGTKSILYGKTVDHIIAARVLLTDGTEMTLENLDPEAYNRKAEAPTREGEIYRTFRAIIQRNEEEIKQRFPKVMRRVGGYTLDEFVYTEQWNLAKLITGSEGTLATTLELTLNLEPLPRHKSVAVVHFAEVINAIEAVKPMLAYQPSAVEILDQTVLRMSKENLTTQKHCHFIEGDPAAILIVEFYGDTAEDVMQRPQAMIEKLTALGLGYAYPLFPEGEAYDDVWVGAQEGGWGSCWGSRATKNPYPLLKTRVFRPTYCPSTSIRC